MVKEKDGKKKSDKTLPIKTTKEKQTLKALKKGEKNAIEKVEAIKK